MHILVVTGSFPAVTQTFVTREVAAARGRHAVSVLAARPERGLASLDAEIRRNCHFLDWRHAPVRPFDLSMWSRRVGQAADSARYGRFLGLRRRAYFAELIRTADLASVDLVHAHWTELADNVGVPLGHLLNVPVTCTAHDSFLADVATATLTHLQDHLAGVAMVSSWSEHEWASRTGSHDRLTVIPNGVDIPPVRERIARGSDLPVLINVARAEPHKRQRDLLEAVALLRRQNVPVRCVIVGGGGGLDELRRLSAELGIQDACRFTGAVPHEQALAELANADIFVLPSERESFGVVTAEAMAAGLPIVATAVGGTLDLVEDGVTGYLVPVGAPAAIAAKLRLLTGDPGRRHQMGAAARARAEREFSFARHMDLMYGFWEDARSRHASGPPRITASGN